MKILLLLLLTLTIPNSWAAFSDLRNCTLLPIVDSSSDVLTYQVFEKVERELKYNKWCEYKSNSDLINILGKYKTNIEEHLNDPKVLKTIGRKLKVGSLIRIKLNYQVNKVEIVLDVMSSNGIDILFSEKTLINSINIEDIANAINNWLDIYSRSIPYDGVIVGVLGDQITFTYPQEKNIYKDQVIIVRKYKSKKIHKLLNKVVEWKSDVVAEARIISIDKNQGLATIKTYYNKKTVKNGEWVAFEPYNKDNVPLNEEEAENGDNSFGQLGLLSLHFNFSNSSLTTSPSVGTNKMNGNIFGGSLKVHGWISRHYFANFEFAKRVGSLDKDSGSTNLSSVSVDQTNFKISGGYKYLILNFFYGPHIDLYGGWANYNYSVESSDVDGFGDSTFSGLQLGVGAYIPFKRKYSLIGGVEFVPFGSFSGDASSINSSSDVSMIDMNIGMRYKYSNRVYVEGLFNIVNNKAEVGGSIGEVSFQDQILKFGATIGF